MIYTFLNLSEGSREDTEVVLWADLHLGMIARGDKWREEWETVYEKTYFRSSYSFNKHALNVDQKHIPYF